jgi:hypothetical protein
MRPGIPLAEFRLLEAFFLRETSISTVVIALIPRLRYEIPLLKGCVSARWMTGGNGAYESEFVIFCH